MSQKSQILTSLACEMGTFCFCVLPFGLKNTPSVFQRYMDNLLSPLRKYRICANLNDIVVGATDEKSHKDITDKIGKTFVKKQGSCPERKMFFLHETNNISGTRVQLQRNQVQQREKK
jgi:Reverse transcriptase (RNA-dependent DNA polymerase)